MEIFARNSGRCITWSHICNSTKKTYSWFVIFKKKVVIKILFFVLFHLNEHFDFTAPAQMLLRLSLFQCPSLVPLSAELGHQIIWLKTRPDTWLPQSRVGGHGPYMKSPEHLGRRSKNKTREAGSQYHCAWVGGGSQPPSTTNATQPPFKNRHRHTQNL